MIDTRPYALIVDRDEESRARAASLLRESGFVVAAFRESRGALAALAARPVDIAVIAGHTAEGEDALGAARQMRHCRPGSKVLFTGPADAMPAAPGPDSGHAVTRPFDKRRFLGAVFELLARGGDPAKRRDEAEMALMAAQLACLRSRLPGFEGELAAGFEGGAAANDTGANSEAALVARWGLGEPPDAA
jgi:DNA-binding response OmpR family regulator